MNLEKVIADMIVECYYTAKNRVTYGIENGEKNAKMYGWSAGVDVQFRYARLLTRSFGISFNKAMRALDAWRIHYTRKFYEERSLKYYAKTASKCGKRANAHCWHSAVVCYEL